ncbi:hypothetical protein F4809DRAFT_607273 [Biscogniauxia mediterranea]|nr:hypothetical protein F4809DRAFT_607273 [Biscogniauxia mediterranea]
MYARTALALLSLAGSLVSAAAAADPEPAKVARDVTPRETSQNLLAAFFRLANQFDVAACIPRALPLITTLPRIPPALLGTAAIDQALSQTTLALADVCRFSVTGDAAVADAYTSFLPAWYAWYRGQSAAIARIVTACPAASALVRTVEAYGRCPQVPRTAEEVSSLMSIQTGTVGGGDDAEALSSAFSIQTDTVVGGDDTTTAGPTATATATSAQSTAATTGAAEAPSPSSTVPTDGAPRETGFILAAAAAAGFVGLVAAL